jgi:hypothetical protein
MINLLFGQRGDTHILESESAEVAKAAKAFAE